MSGRTALVLGGTGMLQGCADELLAQGWQVVLPSRRPPMAGMAARAALGRRGHVPQGRGTPLVTAPRREDEHRRREDFQRAATWVRADWASPADLAERVREVLPAPADLLVAWVHQSYREPVLRAVAPLLAPDAPVVEVHDSGGISPRYGLPEPVLAGHPTQQVVLGFVRHGSTTRWLSHEEASVGVLAAVRRALDGRPSSVHQVGEVDTWVVRS
ncbi:hypothetical protein [Saccharothrix australiensis]|uniref:Short subunit dehydrogenase n=1 Tax=Saccharothrix australiensis TaxID=2072 RepID=A0A495W5Y9_9PSEU|nr:hypothetical protein [Saccharothrix australiensis]RKT56694.1 hypothetical protein C8E97_5403 [Saccharothrix australiensis]